MREGVGMGSIGNTESRRPRDKVNTVGFVLLSFRALSIPFKESDKEMVGFHHLLLTERQTIKKKFSLFDLYGPLVAPSLLLGHKDQTATNAAVSLK